MYERQDRICDWCGTPETVRAVVEHHIYPRSIRPDLIKEPSNKIYLCSKCHDKTESDMEFMKLLQNLFNVKK